MIFRKSSKRIICFFNTLSPRKSPGVFYLLPYFTKDPIHTDLFYILSKLAYPINKKYCVANSGTPGNGSNRYTKTLLLKTSP